MSKMNKIITNNSVQLSESEVNNLITTLGPVIEAFTGGGGGGGSVIYTPGDDNISINNTQHTIALSTDAATKLNTPIPTKVSDLTDSANYATEQYVQAASAEVTGWVNDQNYLTQVPDTYYLKTETSGKDELSAAFDAILNYDVTAAAGIKITTATDNGTTTFGISMTAEPVVTDTNLSGYNGIAAAPDGTKSGWWNVGLTQDMLNTINGKLDSSDFTTYTGTTAPNTYLTKTSADTLYQPTGNYVTTADVLTGTDNTLTGIKIGSTNYTIPTTDLSNYYTKTQVDSTFASATQLNDYLTTAKYQTDSATFALKTQLDDYAPISITATVNTLTAASAGWNEVSAKLGTAQYANDYATFVTSSNASISADDEQYALTTTGWAKVQAGSTLTAGSGVEIVSNGINALLGTDLAFNATTSAIQINTNGTAYGAYAFVEGSNTTASGAGAHAEGVDADAIGQGAHAGGYGTHTTGVGNFIHGTFLNFASPDGTAVSNTPVFVGGTLNATTAQNYNDHGGYLQIMGNGAYTGGGQGNNSDAYILYRDGTVSAKQFQNADGTETINGTTYNFTGVDNIEILPLAATANTTNFPNDNVLRFILES